MRASIIFLSIAVSNAAMSAFGLWSFYRSFDAAPTDFYTYVGKATEVHSSTLFYSKSHARFLLSQPSGNSIEFTYTPRFSRFYYFAEHLKDGMTVEVTVGPGGWHDFWGLKLGAKTLMTADEAYQVRRKDGKWGLALGGAFLLSALWAASKVPDFLRRGV